MSRVAALFPQTHRPLTAVSLVVVRAVIRCRPSLLDSIRFDLSHLCCQLYYDNGRTATASSQNPAETGLWGFFGVP